MLKTNKINLKKEINNVNLEKIFNFISRKLK